MSKKTPNSQKFLAAGLFLVAAIFSFATPNMGARIAGLLFLGAAFYYLFSGLNRK